MSTHAKETTGVILMTYGSATTAEQVPAYFERIYKGKASPATVADFENRYRLIGRSPLIDITNEQAARLEERLGNGYVVRAGMRHSAPSIADAVRECREAGATSLVGIILSPQFSSLIMEGYRTAFREAATKSGFSDDATRLVGPWHTEVHFIELLAKRIEEKRVELAGAYGMSAPIVFTTHSLPRRVVEQDPGYLDQLEGTIAAVRERLSDDLVWYAGYQSAGHTPEEWLRPDLTEILDKLHEERAGAVCIVPIQFLADHLEILYDLDIAARAQCEERSIKYHRTSLPNAEPLFIEALSALVER